MNISKCKCAHSLRQHGGEMFFSIFWKEKDSLSDTDAPREFWGANLTLFSALCTKNRQLTALVTERMPPKRRVGGRVNAHRGQMKQNLPNAFCERQEEKK